MKYFLLFILLTGCYTTKKAERQVNMAAITFPEILAKKARDLFPCVITKGDTIYFSDSAAYIDALNELQDTSFNLYRRNDSLLKQLDSLTKDSICFKLVDIYTQIISNLKNDNIALHEKIKHLPPIIKTVEIHDTTIDNAAVKVCEIEKSKLIDSIAPITTERDKFKKRSRTYFWILLALGAVLGVSFYSKIAGIFRPKLKAVP